MSKKCILVILDGWGIGDPNETNPIYLAGLKTLPMLGAKYPLTSLDASGTSVGLSWDAPGESEVGHLTLGSGRTVYQNEPRINFAIQNGSFATNKALVAALSHVKQHNSSLHLAGLLTKNNTHASLDHLRAIIDLAEDAGIEKIKLDLFADGKDSPPGSIRELLMILPQEKISSLIGRAYAMDRTRTWTLTERAFEALTNPAFPVTKNIEELIQKTLANYPSEEFLPPTRLSEDGAIAANDAVLFFNFRTDSTRQLVESFADPHFSAFKAHRPENLFLASLVSYEKNLPISTAFPEEALEGTVGAVLAMHQRTQLRLAETSKSAHITYFFNGYREEPFPGELRVIVPSLSTPRPEEKPEMMAPAITERLLASIREGAFDFILTNYANSDAMAHTGNFAAGVAAAQLLDREVAKIVAAAEAAGALLVITADHGNLEQMINPADGRPETQHDKNPVPAYFIHPTLAGRRFYNADNLRRESLGTLADIAPTILSYLEIPIPPEMTGKNLLGYL